MTNTKIHKKINEKINNKINNEIVRYLFFGAATTAINWLVYILCLRILPITASNGIAWFCAVLFAYITNKLYVFESRTSGLGAALRELLLFFGARALSGVVEILLPTLLIHIGIDQELFGIQGFAAKAIVSVLIILLNYIFSKLIVFKKS